MPNTYTALYTHLVFSTKHREPLLAKPRRAEVYKYIGGICRNIDCALVDASGMEDHVHLLVRRHPTRAESDIVRTIKSNSSRWLRTSITGFGWQDGGGAFSVSPLDLPRVRTYFANQEQHHKRSTFAQEYERFLKKYGVKYDPKYILD